MPDHLLGKCSGAPLNVSVSDKQIQVGLKPLPDCYIIPARGTQGMLYHVVVTVQLDCRSISVSY